MRTSRQTPVMWVQAGHMTSAIAARSWTLYILLICPWRICKHGDTRFFTELIQALVQPFYHFIYSLWILLRNAGISGN